MSEFQQTSWGPQPAAVVALGIGGLILAVAGVTLVTDVPGRILLGIAAVGLLWFAISSWLTRPKLAICDAGLTVRGITGSTTLRHEDISLIRITEFRRIGRRVRMLEIDTTDGRLRVFTRWDLGTDPIEVLDALTAAGYAR
jgi:Bacterial PH domain